MKRFKHSLSHYKLLTMDMGKLVPIGIVECIPGDTIQQSSSALIRMSPQLAPVMHPITVRIHHWFVPHRLTMGVTWENFITGGTDGLGDGAAIPKNGAGHNNVAGSVGDYLGIPIRTYGAGAFSMLPFRCYNLTYNEYYRDEDLVTAVSQDSTIVQNVAWEKDYFTAARPWTQKGPAVSLPIGTTATVKTSSSNNLVTGVQSGLVLRAASSGALPGATIPLGTTITTGELATLSGLGGTPAASASQYPANLYADLSTATAATVTAVRQAFALQRYQEARAQYGSRYTEYLRYIGVRPSDARMQKPEYLGGGKQTISFSEVLRTGNVTADATPNVIGQLKGHGIAALRSNRYRYFCEEHGYVISMMSIRPKSIYMDGMPRHFFKFTKEEFFQKELELIGQQSILNKEVYSDASGNDVLTFGYQDRYADYRHQPSTVHDEFRTTLNFWHLGRTFGALPVLNQAFIECVPGKRVFAEQSAKSCWVMVNHNIQARRMVGKKVIGRVV